MKKSKIPAIVQPAEKGKVGLTINWIGAGDSKTYACGGFHFSDDDRHFLDGDVQKLRPGDVVYLPAEVAEKYKSHPSLRIV